MDAEMVFPFLAHAPMEPLDAVSDDRRGRLDRLLQRLAVSRPGQGGDRRGLRRRRREGAGQHAARRRQLRPPRAVRLALHARGRGGLQGVRHDAADQAHVDPRGRHPRRLLPADLPPLDQGRARQATATSSPGIRRSSASRSCSKDELDDDHRSRARRTCPMPSPTCACSRQHQARRARPVVALGRPHPYRLRRRDVHRRAAGDGPARIPSRAGWRCSARTAAPCRRPEAGRRDRRIGVRPCRRAAQRGVAVHKSFNTYVAEIAEVSIGDGGLPRVHKVWCAVDCGVAVNPNIITAQMEGGIGYGLGAILFDEIDARRGRRRRPVELPRLSLAAHQRDARGRGGDHRVDRGADRRRRAGRSADRPRRGQCLASAHRPTRPEAASGGRARRLRNRSSCRAIARGRTPERRRDQVRSPLSPQPFSAHDPIGKTGSHFAGSCSNHSCCHDPVA